MGFGDGKSRGDTEKCLRLWLKLSATPDRFRIGPRSTRSGSGDCPGTPAHGPLAWEGNGGTASDHSRFRAGLGERTACSGEPWRSCVGRGPGFQPRSGFISLRVWVFASVCRHYFLLSGERERWQPGGEPRRACDEVPRSARSAEGRSRKCWAWSCVGRCGWLFRKHGAGLGDQRGRNGLARPGRRVLQDLGGDNAGADVLD